MEPLQISTAQCDHRQSEIQIFIYFKKTAKLFMAKAPRKHEWRMSYDNMQQYLRLESWLRVGQHRVDNMKFRANYLIGSFLSRINNTVTSYVFFLFIAALFLCL